MESLIHTFGIDWRLLAIQALNFGVLAGLLTWLLYKPVMKIVKERQEFIAKGVEDASEAARKLKEADTIAGARVSGAEKTADEILKGARVEAAVERSALLKDAEARAAQVERDAEARAKEDAARRRQESEKEIARLAILAAEKVIRPDRTGTNA